MKILDKLTCWWSGHNPVFVISPPYPRQATCTRFCGCVENFTLHMQQVQCFCGKVIKEELASKEVQKCNHI